MEDLEMILNSYKGRRVLVTGHTGFKGSWLSIWLKHIGSDVYGYSLSPSSDPNMFSYINFYGDDKSVIGDIRDKDKLNLFIDKIKPEIIFHLAAQPIVLVSYEDPVYTYETNITGLVNLLEAARNTDSVRYVIVITSDKCYLPAGKKKYAENDKLGGYDPYSASKACAEIISFSYYHSFFKHINKTLATARAGNIIGGGDWSEFRIIPDIIRAITSDRELVLRYPDSVRPWQHVLDASYGYLLLGVKLMENNLDYARSWNFGPDKNENLTVSELCNIFEKEWGRVIKRKIADHKNKHLETDYLSIDSSNSKNILGWKPLWEIGESVRETVKWYREYYNFNQNPVDICLKQIDNYIKFKKRQN